ncbi:hypothetical protein ScPMuIL_013507 [Solemya velum]
MDAPSGFRQPRKKGHKSKSQKPQLFEDTSVQQQPQFQHMPQSDPGYGYGPPQQQGGYDPNMYGSPETQYPGQPMFGNPMASMAMQYGASLAGQGTNIVQENVKTYVSTSKLKYYFAVDTAYVGKKLGLIAFPFTHTDWSIKYNQDEPIAPRYEVNAPDLYIPVMAFVTYILVAGVVLGTQDRFTPEQLGIQASTALVWLVLELLAILFSMYLMNVKTDLKYLDMMCYIGYKFVGMIFCLLASLIMFGAGYYCVLGWFSLSIVFFLIRTLRVQILPHSEADGFTRGAHRTLYLILAISALQPFLMWWLTRNTVYL